MNGWLEIGPKSLVHAVGAKKDVFDTATGKLAQTEQLWEPIPTESSVHSSTGI
jgi:hypothetical protein